MAFDLGDYQDVKTRHADFKAKHPEGCLRPADLAHPYRVETIGSQTFIVFVAAAHRTPDDPCPGIGTAWEPFPGKTPYTKDSELQNAETSAWGRAIAAVLAVDLAGGVASRDEVRNRQRDQDFAPPAVPYDTDPELIAEVKATVRALPEERAKEIMDWAVTENFPTPWSVETCRLMMGRATAAIQADAIDLAATPCYLCGSTQSRRVLDAHDRVRCSVTKGCEERQNALEAPFAETTA